MDDVQTELRLAQARAAALFESIEKHELIRPGVTEEGLNQSIFELASSEFGVEKHWHRRVIRSGPNTRLQFRALPPDRAFEDDDIVSIDLGPVFGAYEADFGRTFVLGHSPEKLRLVSDLEQIFRDCQSRYVGEPTMTGRDLFAYVVAKSAERGWGFGGAHAGHLVGPFPVASSDRDAAANRIRPDNEWPMNAPDAAGRARHWILEVHLLDPTGTFGGFYEELLTP